MKKRLLAPALALLLTACGAFEFASKFRIIVAAGAPVLTVFVQQGKISETFRLKLVGDLNEEAGNISVLGTCLDGATDKPAKLQCVQSFQRSTRPVLERNFKTNQTVRFIADDIDAVIEAAIIYYGGVSTNSSIRTASVKTPVTAETIKQRIEKLKQDLGQQ